MNNNWKLKAINTAYKKTTETRYFNYIVKPNVINLIGNTKDKTVLDVGCGFGRYLEILSKHDPSKLVGCDISEHQIQLCKESVQNKDIEYYIVDFSDASSSIALGQNKYDIVYNVLVLLYIETLDKLKTFIENCYKCLKKGGKMVICTSDIKSASFYPEVFNILKLSAKPLTKDNEYTDGCPIQLEIIENCIVTCYQRNFETIKQLMEQVGFTDVRKCDLFLEEISLEAFTDKELNIIKKSNIFLFLEAKKL
ncbi:unnamed protein product [Brassicogethes aeneus]|uniref:Methyltransferase type 11 domain-containing protein n=1 Tax=Brassicogethes aeneus TaxID=1431903 RepID=A0A9P0FD58_BRAAE|nr:unnamed protein product [Brassicogethes aeneus]